MKCIGGPGGGIGGLVMGEMNMSEEYWSMHQPMHPIKIGIMDQKHEGESQEIINHAEFLDVPVEICPRVNHPKYKRGHGSKNQNRQQGIKNITAIILMLGKFMLDPSPMKSLFEHHIKNQKCQSGYQEVAEGNILRYLQPTLEKFT